jgi:hypothetical protein
VAPGILIITVLQRRVKWPMRVTLSNADDVGNRKTGRAGRAFFTPQGLSGEPKPAQPGGSQRLLCRGLFLRPCWSWPEKCQRTVHDSA